MRRENYTSNKKAMSLDWCDQCTCEQLDFCLPWKIAGWQPSSFQFTLLSTDAVPGDQQVVLLVAQTCLHQLTTRSRNEVPLPDGPVTTALYTFLTALGCELRHARSIHAQCSRAQMPSVCTLTRTRRLRVTEFWRQVGAVTSNEDAVTHSRPQACPLCELLASVFFKIQKEHGEVSETLIRMGLWKQQEVLTATLQEDGLSRANNMVAQAADNHGLNSCFGCAARFLPDVCRPPVPQPSCPPSRMTPSGSMDHHACSQYHQVVGKYRVPSDQTESFRHDSPLPLKQQRHAPGNVHCLRLKFTPETDGLFAMHSTVHSECYLCCNPLACAYFASW